MANLASLVTRSRLCLRAALIPRCQTAHMATMKVMSPEEHKISREEFWQKNERLNRPLSPHLLIYKLQITSLMSVTHRATGMVLAGLLYGSAAGVLILPGTFPTTLAAVSSMQIGAPLIFMAKMAISWPLCYHMLNGIRHLAWDLGYGFQMSDLHKTGWAVVLLSIALGVGVASL